MIQGDHGPVAFRNIRYRLMRESDVTMSDITYKVYHGNFKSINDFINGKPLYTGSVPQLTWEVAGAEDAFAVVYNATIKVPEDDRYEFSIRQHGDAILKVAGQTLEVNENSERAIQLTKGNHPLELIYFKDINWLPPQLGLFVMGSDTYPKALHTFNSLPPGANLVSPIPVKVGSDPKLLRAFLDFDNDRSQRLTHTMAVGDPGGVHYIYDLKAGNISCVWHGEFLNATPMWHDRGDGSYRPVGMVQYLFTSPSLALLSDQQAAFPPLSNEIDFDGQGYSIDESSGRPVFKYLYKGITVEDKVYPAPDNKALTREVTFKNVSGAGFHFKLAEGADISSLPDGTFIIDREYYIKILSNGMPLVRNQSGGKKELILPVDGNPTKYLIIW
jgi:hypothetical protein